LTIPHRGATTESTYFVTANVLERKSLFQVDKIARLFIEVLMDYRGQKKYLLHEFVVMPDHFHLILTPRGITLERAVQFPTGSPASPLLACWGGKAGSLSDSTRV
jgi:putative transposase